MGFVVFVFETVSLRGPGCSGTLSRSDWPQAHRDGLASASLAQRLKVCTTTWLVEFLAYFIPGFRILGEGKSP